MDSTSLSAFSRPLLKRNPHVCSNQALSARCLARQQRRLRYLAVECLHRASGGSANSNLSCAAVASDVPKLTSDEVSSPKLRLKQLVNEFVSLTEPLDRVKRLLEYASSLPSLPASDRVPSNRVMGCTAQVWLSVSTDGFTMKFSADSDSEITKGYCACLISVLDGSSPDEILQFHPEDFSGLNVIGSAGKTGTQSRVNTWHNVLISMQKRAKMVIAEREGRSPVDPFPSLIIGRDGIRAQGSYAEAQAMFLSPDESKVEDLVKLLKSKKIGIVAHFYMDPEVQGVLTAAKKHWPHIHISDSLVMADSAVRMAEAGCEFVAVLGVDFMSENVRAILDQAGFDKVGVYRMSDAQIGCSLADAASSETYTEFIETASKIPPSLHVIYINTSLETKAMCHELVPTITCTSSNVVQTILQAFAQVNDLNVFYGPDSYMGANIAELFQQMANLSDEEIKEIHSGHDRNSIKSVLQRLHYYQEGNCIVHDIFGQEVVDKLKDIYLDAFLTAHFEVPGEMFALAMEAKQRGMGVVGSTQNILDFIKNRVKEALERNVDEHLQFVLGTESGMITSIVATVCELLSSQSSDSPKVEVEIVFPVSSDSVSDVNGSNGLNGSGSAVAGLGVVPGVAAGEGCSIHGGCASCPYMKMNSLSALLRVCQQIPDKTGILSAYQADRFTAKTPLGKSVAEIGCEPILHMRHFQATGKLPEKLVNQICSNNGKASS
ncbi:hypothetical protein LUZ60_007812 [Juncus effusus]|nr:hypothetical protein LUZ60_007812 [Juncus effusus]